MSEVIDVKKLTKDFSEQLKTITLESNVAKIIEQFEEKANKLSKDISDFEVRRLNLSKDCQNLQETYADLKKKNDNLSQTLSEAIDKAVKEEKAKAEQLTAELSVEKGRATDEHRKLASSKEVYEEKAKECERVRIKLVDTVKHQEALNQETLLLKNKLNNVISVIKGVLDE